MKKIVIERQRIALVDVEEPVIEHPKRVLVKVHYSSISPGTELGLIRNPTVKDGLALGYSASGEVMDVGAEVTKVKKGDLVAVYGAPYVYHAEMLSVPESLCVKLKDTAMLKEAAFVGLGAVAVHSVRRMSVQFGESVWVVGLGLLGQIVAQLCSTANYRVFATDMNEGRCELARSSGVGAVFSAADAAINQWMEEFTEGSGFDAIALCAHSSHMGIIESCMEKLAFRGRFAVIGNVPVTVPRELFFQKEADFVIARAAGPGRYDPVYEQESIDYPRAYVRWTEGRNMAEFIRQIEAGRLAIRGAITHEFVIRDAMSAYEALSEEPGKALGVLLRYT